MWYNHLDRTKPYLRSYRNVNLHVDQYDTRLKGSRVASWHINIFRRLGKHYSGHRTLGFLWGTTFVCFAIFLSRIKYRLTTEDKDVEVEMYHRLHTIFQKNKYGYHTRIFADFENLLQGALNQKFINNVTNYYDDPTSGPEIEDIENGLNSDMSKEDIRNLLADKHDHGEEVKTMRFPGRHGLNYGKSDDLSPYKVLPKGTKPKY